MANEITVTPAEVRGLIDVQMPAAALPDQTIALKAYAGAAIVEVKGRAPDWASYTPDGDEATALNRAADCITAALIVPAYPNLTIKDTDGVKHQRQAFDVEAKVAALRDRAEAALATVLSDGTVTDAMPTMFTLGCGRRGA